MGSVTLSSVEPTPLELNDEITSPQHRDPWILNHTQTSTCKFHESLQPKYTKYACQSDVRNYVRVLFLLIL